MNRMFFESHTAAQVLVNHKFYSILYILSILFEFFS